MEKYKNEEYLKKQIMEQSRHLFIYGYDNNYRSKFLQSMESDYPIIIESNKPVALYFNSLGLPKIDIDLKDKDTYLIHYMSREYLYSMIASKILERSMEIDEATLNSRLSRLISLINRINVNKGNEYKEIETVADLLKEINMYLKNTSNEVKELVLRMNELDRKNKLKFVSYIFNLWDRNQINSLNEVNPNLFDDGIDIDIFNPSSIDCPYLINEIKEYWNYNYNLYRLYPKEYRKLIPIFEKLSFKEKKDVLAELFLMLEHDGLLPDNIDGYEIARRIIKY